MRFPPFWLERPAVWFAQAEAQFFHAGIYSEKSKFFHVISQLDQRCAAELEDITAPPEQSPYITLKAELVRRQTPAREQRIRQLLTHEEIGDRKPSQLLRHLRSLVPDVPDDFLRPIWASRLPPNIQAILAFQPESSLDSEVASQPELATVEPNPGKTALLQGTSPSGVTHS
jgi:hypothetical protein